VRAGALGLALAALAWAAPAGATGFTELGQELKPRSDVGIKLEGYFRTRGELLYNLDLDRGLTPSGQPLYPVPSDGGQKLYGGDLRLRTDLSVFAPGGTVMVKVRVDTLDNVAAGSDTTGNYAAATTQTSSGNAMRVKRAYGLALTPVGVLLAGRMGNQWGLGMLANGGDCADCDSGDAADRVAFLTPLLGHVWGLAYDISATGPVTSRKDGVRRLDFEPTDNVQTVTFVVLNFREDEALARRRRAGKGTAEYGAYLSHRWQQNDIPSSYLPVASPVPYSTAQVVRRGYKATALDGWLRLTWPSARIEVEAAWLDATVEQASLLPGVELRKPVKSRQIGAALESEFGSPDGRAGGGLNVGYASGDDAPGFGAFPPANGAAPKAGDLEGAQANPPRDNRIDNFRFSPDYRVDRILFREIIGAVTDAVYLRPHGRVVLFRNAAGQLSATLAAVSSWAVSAASPPGRQGFLGVELDPTLIYQSHDGFTLALDHGVFFPGAGFDNPSANLSARPAQVLRARLLLRFLAMRRCWPLLILLQSCAENETPVQSKAAYQAPELAPLACVPNLDGRIDANELQAAFNVPVSYLVSPSGEERAVDFTGQPNPDGTFSVTWDADYATDRVSRITAQPLGDQWFASLFPGGEFVAPFDAGATTLSVYAHSDSALLLLGVASAVEEPPQGKTLLVYTTPITLYQFPIAPGASWVSTGEVKNGFVRGLLYAGKDTYETKVDGMGKLALPDLTFAQALRVKTRVVLQPAAGAAVITRQTSFLFECFGEVARATSRNGEEDENFKTAAEVRRLGL